jgi:GNAT superfamily N-acetyltransferase
VPSKPSYRSRPYDPDRHDAAAFDCGEVEITQWLRQHARAAARARVAQTFVWTAPDQRRVVGYYTVSAHSVARAEAPSRIGRGVPDPVPAALIGKLGLDRSLHGQGLGEMLLVDALARILTASDAGPAVRAIVVDASTASRRKLYERMGFVCAPKTTGRMLIKAATVSQAFRR